MTPFYHNILKAINDYKNIIKRNFATKERQAMLIKLGIKRFDIKNANEIKLYAIGATIVRELEQSIRYIEKQQSTNCYFGTEEFLQYLKKLLNDHVIEGGVVINVAQQSSCALIKAIQLIETAKHGFNNDVAEQIYACTKVIAKYGDKEQKRMFYRLINSANQSHLNLFFRQLQNVIS